MTEAPTETVAPEDQPQGTGDPLLDKLMEDLVPEPDSPYLKMFVFGEPGCGKTTLAATTPNPLFIDVERGVSSVPHIAKSKENRYRFRDIRRLEVLIEKYLVPGHPQFDKYDTIVLDSLSEIHKRGLTEVAKRNSGDGRATSNVIIGSDHQENNERVRRIVSMLRDIDRNIFVTCHVQYAKEQGESGLTTYRADFSDKLNNTVAAVFDICAYMKQETDVDNNTAAIMTFRSAGVHKVKTRVSTLPNTMVNPTWDKIYSKYQEYINSGEK
jgi:phage nucleotide-binding protein